MNNDALTPRWLKPAAVYVLIGTIALVAVVLGLILLGIADPKPLGTEIVDQRQTLELITDSTAHSIYPSALDGVQCPCTIEAEMRQISGARIGAYGVWWRAGDSVMTAALNGNGYYAVFDGESNFASEWRRFPWLLPQGEANRLWVDLAGDGSAMLRINDEIAVVFEWNGVSPIEVGYYVEGDEGGSVVMVSRLRVWGVE